VSNRKRFEELCDIKNIELGMVKVPPDILEDLINKENIEKFYDVNEIPVASGLFATVRKCTHRESGIEYAAKFSSRLRYEVDCTTEVLHEIALLSMCAGSNKIVHLKDVFQNKQELILVLEYAPGGDFQSVLDDDMVPFEQDVQGFMLQLLEALSFAHERNIAHLDIKPQNIVLMSEFPNCEIKLCDLEVSRVIQEHEQIREIIGTPDYVAPEILAYEPISLAADIWSLGVTAYALLTGFSPFGGETDQETLRNIASAALDFPAELFEGVSDEAKEFITACLHRNPRCRPTVEQCLQHPWIARDSEPPSPSPLMLKIPAPDHFVSSPSPSHKLSVHSPSGSSRRSCQTCRDKLTERKRYLSKSREAIFEKVTNSNLKKSLSKSRERLCDMRLTLGKSREYLHESKLASRSQEKFYSFKSISKSQEVLSQGLGGNMKRINGAVSDISPHHLPTNPRVYIESQDNCDFVILPGSSVLMSHSDLMSIAGIKNSGSLQLLPISESGRSTPASLCSNATVADIPYSGDHFNDHLISQNTGQKPHVEPLVEVAEEDIEEEDNKIKYSNETRGKGSTNNLLNTRRKSKQETTAPRTFNQKEEKNNINYETKQSMNRSGNINNNNNNNNNRQQTAEVAVQVDLTKSSPVSNEVIRRKEKVEKIDSLKSSNTELNCSPFMQLDGNLRQEKKLTRGFSHDDTLGEEHKRYSWREELEKFRSTKKGLAVSDLIDAFSSNSMHQKVSSEDPSFPNLDSMKNKRRGSLQIQIDPKAFAKLTETEEKEKAENHIKLQRRKSTSAILPLRLSEVKMADIDETVLELGLGGKPELEENNEPEFNNNSEQNVSEDESVGTETDNEGSTAPYTQSLPKGRVYMEKVNERKRTWDYFEINHPKAISDKKLEQLKAKYTRRKTEADILSNSKSSKEKNDNEKSRCKAALAENKIRTVSMPVFEGLVDSPQPKKPLDLAFDPLTGECLSGDTESVDSGRESETVRKLSTDSSEESTASSSRKSSKSGRRKSSNLVDIIESEQLIPEEKVLECFIDPFTGQFITNEVSKQSQVKCQNNSTTGTTNKKNLKVNIEVSQQDDDGIGSLPITPTDLVGKTKSLSLLKKPLNIKCEGDSESIPTDDGIYTSSEEVVTSGRADSVSSEDCQDVHSGSSVSRQDKNANVSQVQATDNASDTKLINMVNKVCSGSVSRGIEKFKGKKHCEEATQQ